MATAGAAHRGRRGVHRLAYGLDGPPVFNADTPISSIHQTKLLLCWPAQEVPSCPPPSPTSFGSSSPSRFAHRSSGAPALTPDTTSHTGAADAAGNRTSSTAIDRSAAPVASLLPPSPSPAASPSGLVQPLSPPPHSYMEVHYPFTTLPWLWRQYHRPGFPGLDPALVIEDFDTFAADVAARHVGHVPDSMLVTAFLERMTWHVHLRPGDGIVPAAGGAGGCGDDNYSGSDYEQRSLPLTHLAPTDMRMSGQVGSECP